MEKKDFYAALIRSIILCIVAYLIAVCFIGEFKPYAWKVGEKFITISSFILLFIIGFASKH